MIIIVYVITSSTDWKIDFRVNMKNIKSDSYETDSSDFEDIYDDNELR